MIHAGKTPKGELQLTLSESDIAFMYGMIKGTSLQERRAFHGVRTFIEKEFPEYSK